MRVLVAFENAAACEEQIWLATLELSYVVGSFGWFGFKQTSVWIVKSVSINTEQTVAAFNLVTCGLNTGLIILKKMSWFRIALLLCTINH